MTKYKINRLIRSAANFIFWHSVEYNSGTVALRAIISRNARKKYCDQTKYCNYSRRQECASNSISRYLDIRIYLHHKTSQVSTSDLSASIHTNFDLFP